MAEKPRRTLRKVVFLGALATCAAVLALRNDFPADADCTALRRRLPALVGLDLGVNSCELDPITQTVTLRGLSAFSPGSDEPLFAADEAVISLRTFRLPYSVELDRVVLERPRFNLDLSRASSRTSGEDDCPLGLLQRVQIDRLEVKGAEVRALLPGGRRLEVVGLDVNWTLRRGITEFQVDARRGSVSTGEGRELLLSRLLLEGGLDVSEQSLELTRGEAALDEATVSVAGRVDSLCDPSLALGGQVFLPMSTVARAVGTREKVSGHLWSRVSLTGRAWSPIAQVDVVGSELGYGRFSPGDFTARLAFAGDEITLSELSAPAGAGTVRASGTLKLERSLPLRLKVETENAQFGSILAKAGLPGSWVDFPASVKGTFTGALSPGVSLSGDAEVKSGRFMLTSRAFDAPRGERSEGGDDVLLTFGPARTTLHLAIHPDRVELTNGQLEVSPGNTRVSADATLHFAPDTGLSIHGRGQAVDLSDFGHIAGLEWSGNGSAGFAVEGPYEDIAIASQVALRDFTFWGFGLGVAEGRVDYHDRVLSLPGVSGQKGKTQYFGQGELRWSPSGELFTRADLKIPKGQSSDVVDLIAGLSPSVAVFQGTVGGDASGSLHIEGPASRFGGTVALDLTGTTYYGRRLGEGRMVLHFVDGAALVLDKTVLTGPMGVGSVDGSWAFSGPLDYRFRFEQAPLPELFGPERAKALGLTGLVTLVGKVEGDATTPLVSAYLTSPAVGFAGKGLGATQLEARIEGRDLQVWGRPFDDARALVKLKLREPYPFDGSVSIALPEIRPLLPEGAVSQGVSGALSGAVNATGNLRDFAGVQANARIDKLSLSRGDFAGVNDGPIALTYAHGRLGVESFGFKGPNTELSAEGWYGPDEVDMSMRGAFDMRLLESFVPELERTAGRVEVQAAATGSARKPSVVGTAEVKDVRLSLRDQPLSLRSLSGRVEFSEARVLIQDGLGILNDGRVSVRGDLRLSEFALQRLEVSVGLEEVSLRPVDYLPLTVSGELLLAGTPDALQLSGGLDIVKLRYEQQLELAALLKDVRQGRFGGSEKPKECLRFDVDVAASGDVRVDNNLAKAKVTGKLKLTGTNLRPGLLGTIEAAEGSQAFYRGNQFAISKGELQFKDRDRVDALVDLNAQTQVREFLVTLKAFGRLSDPKVLLTAEPALSEGDILSLLTLGVTSRDRRVSTEAGAGLAAEALFS
ncbi:MAG: translocation/assembly module TamB domain-containing protein, partial [Myxococcaceae bacterium]